MVAVAESGIARAGFPFLSPPFLLATALGNGDLFVTGEVLMAKKARALVRDKGIGKSKRRAG